MPLKLECIFSQAFILSVHSWLPASTRRRQCREARLCLRKEVLQTWKFEEAARGSGSRLKSATPGVDAPTARSAPGPQMLGSGQVGMLAWRFLARELRRKSCCMLTVSRLSGFLRLEPEAWPPCVINPEILRKKPPQICKAAVVRGDSEIESRKTRVCPLQNGPTFSSYAFLGPRPLSVAASKQREEPQPASSRVVPRRPTRFRPVSAAKGLEVRAAQEGGAQHQGGGESLKPCMGSLETVWI